MDIELYSVLSAIIVLATAITVLFALFSYLVFRRRQKASIQPERPKVIQAEPAALEEPEFFRPYAPKRLR